MPLVEQTRARTQELFQQLLDRHGVGSRIEVKAFYPSAGGSQLRFVDESLAWEPGMELGFGYWINGEWDSTSWPGCFAVEDDDRITKEDLVYPFNSKPEHLGLWSIVEEFEDLLPPDQLTKVLRQDHYWAVSMGGSNEFVECFCWGAVVEGGSGAVVQFVGDGVEVGLVAGDGGSFG